MLCCPHHQRLVMGLTAPKERKYLSADALFGLLRNTFAQVPDHGSADAGIPLRDALMSGFAMFSLKCPSLLDFDKRRAEDHLHTLYGFECAPCDSCLHVMHEHVTPPALPPAVVALFPRPQ